MNKGLRMSTTFGILWNGLSQFSTQAFQLIVIMILARMLSPKDFGIVGLATVFIGLITVFNEMGLSAAIIQRKDINDVHLSTSFWANVMMSIILFIFFVLISPFIADFFQEDIIRPILIVSSTGLIIGSFNIVHKSLLEKSLDFKKITIVEVCAALTSGIISILLAVKGFGVWSIILGSIFSNIISVIILWNISKWRPSLKFSIVHFKELFSFGGNVMGSRLVGHMAMRMDYLIVGKLLGVVPLGYYSLARNLTSLPVQKISWTVTRVVFPALSTVQGDNKVLINGYLKVIRYVSLITFPMFAGMLIVAPEFVLIFYGEKWSSIIILLQILSIEGAIVSISTLTNAIQYVKGRSDLQFKWQLYTTITLPVAIIIGAKYGIIGIAIMLTVMMAIYAIILQIITNRLIGLSIYAFIKEIIPAAICSVVLIVGVELYKRITFIDNIGLIYIFISSVFIGTIVYIILIRTFYSHIFDEIKLLFSEIRGKTMKS